MRFTLLGWPMNDPFSSRVIYDDSVRHGEIMRVAKWGHSLAVRLPAAVVEALNLKEGDEIEIRIAADRTVLVERNRSREQALERLRRLRRSLPPGFRFNRDEANRR